MNKIYSFFTKIILLIPAVGLVLLIRLLKPLVVVRFLALDIGRIGGMYPAEWYLAERNADMHREKYFDIFYCIKTTGSVCNQQWLKMWKRVLFIPPFWILWQMVDRLNKRFPGYQSHRIAINFAHPIYGQEYKGIETTRCVLNNIKPSLSFTPQEEILGQTLLRHLGIPEGRPFVCFHARDSLI